MHATKSCIVDANTRTGLAHPRRPSREEKRYRPGLSQHFAAKLGTIVGRSNAATTATTPNRDGYFDIIGSTRFHATVFPSSLHLAWRSANEPENADFACDNGG
jgi:hypothetical protein